MTTFATPERPAKKKKIGHEGPQQQLCLHLRNAKSFYLKKPNLWASTFADNKFQLFFSDSAATGTLEEQYEIPGYDFELVASDEIPYFSLSELYMYATAKSTVYKFHSNKLIIFQNGIEETLELPEEVFYSSDDWFYISELDESTNTIVRVTNWKYSVFDLNKKQWTVHETKLPVARPESAALRSTTSQLFTVDERCQLSCYDIRNDKWSCVIIRDGNCPHARKEFSVYIEPTNQQFLLLYGGCSIESESLWKNDLWAFQFGSNSWTQVIIEKKLTSLSFPLLEFAGDRWLITAGDINTQGILFDLAVITDSCIALDLASRTSPYELVYESLLADVEVVLRDGTVKAHSFIIADYSRLQQMTSTEKSRCILDLSNMDISYHVFQSYLLKALYASCEDPKDLDIVNTFESAKMLGLNEYADYLQRRIEFMVYDNNMDVIISILQTQNASCLPFVLKLFTTLSQAGAQTYITEIRKRKVELPGDIVLKLWEASLEESSIAQVKKASSLKLSLKLDHHYDVYLCDTARTVRIGAHKAILTKHSDYFKGLFTSAFQDSEDLRTGTTNEVTLDCSGEVLQNLVAILYSFLQGTSFTVTGASHDESLSLLLEVIRLADELLMNKKFFGQLIKAALKSITAEKLIELYKITENVEVWRVIMATFDDEAIKVMFDNKKREQTIG